MKWESRLWEEVLTIKNGKNQKKVQNPNGEFPIYGSGGIMGYADDYICEAGTTVIGRKGSINNPLYVGEKFWNVDTAFGLSPGEKLDKKYLYYFCITYNFLKHNKATTLPSLTKTDLLKIKIPVPPLPEQKKIAEILDAADSLRQKDRQLIDHYTTLSQSLFLEMFGDPVTNPMKWVFTKLNALVTKLGDGLHGTPVYSDEGEYYFINGNNLQHGVIELNSSTKKVSQDEFIKYKKELNEKTMLVSINGTIGKVAFYNGEKIILGKSACYFNVEESLINKIYLFYLIENPYFMRYASGMATGSTIKNVSLKTMRDFPVPMPSNKLQNQFAERIRAIEDQKQQAQASLEKSEALFNSLLQRAFTGELTENMAA